MRSRLLWLVTAVALIAAPSSGWAQRTTGDIRGVITDESGAVLPGVTVTLRGPAVQGMPTTVSNELGRLPVPESRPWRLRDFGRTGRVRHQDADQHPGHPRHHAGSAGPDERQHAAGDDYRRRRFSDRRRRHHRAQLEHDARMGGERTAAPVHVLRPHQRRAGRLDGEHLRLSIAGVRVGDQREPVPARWHRLHRAALGRRVAVAEHRRDRRGAGAVGRRQRRVRQRRRRRVQHRHPAGLEPVPRRREHLLSAPEPHRFEHDGRGGRRLALQPGALRRFHHAAGRADPEGQAVVLRVVPVPAGPRVAARHPGGIPGEVERQPIFLEVELQPQPEPSHPGTRRTTTSTRSRSAPRPTRRRAPSRSTAATTRRPVCSTPASSTRRPCSKRATRGSTALPTRCP